jgi:hypothetical protein
MRKYSMHATILLTKMSLVMLSFLHIVDLHTTVTFRSEKQTAFIVKAERRD